MQRRNKTKEDGCVGGRLKIASWNVNSINVRLEQVLNWLNTSETDVLALQETKVIDSAFPKEPFLEQGYHLSFAGQKSYNGVALISRHPIKDIGTSFLNFPDEQRRLLMATIKGIRIVNIYVPNGAAVGTDKYQYKLEWLSHLNALIQHQLSLHEQILILGDFNIAPEDRDVHDPKAWEGNVLVSPLERAAFASLLSLGFKDSFREIEQGNNHYSWWDYRVRAFARNLGLRIDHILLSPSLCKVQFQAGIDRLPRSSERPSDHAPVWVQFNPADL